MLLGSDGASSLQSDYLYRYKVNVVEFKYNMGLQNVVDWNYKATENTDIHVKYFKIIPKGYTL